MCRTSIYYRVQCTNISCVLDPWRWRIDNICRFNRLEADSHESTHGRLLTFLNVVVLDDIGQQLTLAES